MLDLLVILPNDARAGGHVVLRTHDDGPITAMYIVVSNLQWFTRYDVENLHPVLG